MSNGAKIESDSTVRYSNVVINTVMNATKNPFFVEK